MNTRRNFLKEGTLATAALLASKPLTTLAKCSSTFSFKAGAANTICILHTGDLQNNIYPIFNDRFNGLGGTEAMSRVIESLKKEKQNIVLVDAGNIFSGNAAQKHQHEKTMQLMHGLNYDAVLPGHHDFAAGEDYLYQCLQKNNLPVVITNYDIDHPLGKMKLPYRIVKKGNIKVGIISAGINLNQFGNKTVQYINPLKATNKFASMLKKEYGCHLVVCLSHLGYKNKRGIDDITLAKNSADIDIILGAHSKTFFKAPIVVHNKNKHEVIINHAGFGGIVLGKLDISFDEMGNKKMVSFTNMMIGTENNKWKQDIA